MEEIKLLKTQLELAQQIAVDARETEKQFLANMNHEIRTPLNAIIGMTHLLFDTQLDVQQHEYLAILKTSAESLLSLVSDLLERVKVEERPLEAQHNLFGSVNTSVENPEEERGTYTFPVQPADITFPHPDDHVSTTPTNLGTHKILVAEDNLMNQKYISGLLSKWNMDFTVVSDGKEAVEQAQNQRFSMILMDIQMPNIDGYEATITIRNTQNPNQNTPIVALTASAPVDLRNKALLIGMNDFIAKPFVPTDLQNVIQQYLKNTEIHVEPSLQDHNNALLNYDRLKELYGDDKEYATIMIQTFLDEVVPDFAIMNEIVAQQDTKALIKYIHKLKPTLGMVGLISLEVQMKQFEIKVKQESTINILQPLWNNFQQGMENAVPLLEAELQRLLQE